MYKIFGYCSLLLLFSCSKVLDQVPEFTIAEDNYWQTANDAESAAVGMYPTIQSLAQQSPLAFDAASDAATVVNSANYAPFGLHGIPVDNLIARRPDQAFGGTAPAAPRPRKISSRTK